MKHKFIFFVLFMLIGIGCCCGYRYYHDEVLPEKKFDEAYDEQIDLFDQVKPQNDNNLQPAKDVNESVVGWLTINGTHIDYPICQSEDNDFYLHNGFDGEYNNELGCPFLDYLCDEDFRVFNYFFYGHHITKQRMFADIALFKDKAFLQSHPTAALTTGDGEHNVQFFAYMTVSSTAPAYNAVFVSDADKEEYIDYIFSDAQYTISYTAEKLKEKKDLHLLLLSTCTYEFNDARGILIGVIEEK